MKKHKNFILFIGAVVFIFLGRFIFMQASCTGIICSNFIPGARLTAKQLRPFLFLSGQVTLTAVSL
jgi:hypothetical protein